MTQSGYTSKPKRALATPHSNLRLSKKLSEEILTELISVLRPSLSSQCQTESAKIRTDYLTQCIWSKYASPLPGAEFVEPDMRKALAIAKWQAAEERNSKTNSRLKTAVANFGFSTSTRVLEMARKFIVKAIGATPPRFSAGGYTNGASTRVSRRPDGIPTKFEGRPHATTEASEYFGAFALEYPLWGKLSPESFDPEIVSGSVMFTVPKNSRIDRVACKEPEVNMYLQRGYGSFIRARLKKNGIDLNDQSRNQKLCFNGRHKGLATLDLSSASDTISRELVFQLLPERWFEALDAVRVKEVLTPQSTFRHRLEMFSSMGNGFTFELESLIFWALVRSICYLSRVPGTISVYGDDIIVPVKAAGLVSQCFHFFGFIVNQEKSCIKGEFRESCGAHWYGTMDVKPFYIRDLPRTQLDVMQIANQIMAWCVKEEFLDDIPHDLIALWGFLASKVPSFLYGGQSLERTDALVTGHCSRRLVFTRKTKLDIPQLGGYLAWHHQKERGLVIPLSLTDISVEGRMATRANRSWHNESVIYVVRRLITYFLGKSASEAPSSLQ